MFYFINEDISDGMIEDNAKIWCMFCNTDVSKALDDAVSQTKELASKELEAAESTEEKDKETSQQDSDNNEINESMLNEKAGPRPFKKPPIKKPPIKKPSTPRLRKTPTTPKKKPATPKKKPVSTKTKTTAPATPAAPAAPKPTLGQRIANATTTVKNTAVLGLTGAVGTGAYKVYDKFFGKGNPDAVKVNSDGSVDIDSWNNADFKDQKAAVKAGKVDPDDLPTFERWKYKFIAPRADKGWPAENIALAAAAAYGLWKGRDYIWTRVKEFADWISSGKSLAVCEFKSDGDDYKAVFDISSKKWKLYYAGSTITKESSYPPKELADKFFNTKFFSRLTETCWKHTDKYLNDKVFAAVASAACSTKGISSSSKDALKDIFKHKKQILENLKNGKYEYI